MTLEPSHFRTVSIRAVMPPKPAPQTIAPAISMAEDAKRVNARYRKAWLVAEWNSMEGAA